MRAIWLAMMLLIVTIFTGCQMGDRTDDETGMRDPNVEQTRHHDDMNRQNNQNIRDNDRQGATNMPRDDKRDNRNDETYDVQEEAAERITEEIEDINYAYVLTTNRNAYVAAVLDRDDDTTDNRDQSMTNDNNTRTQDGERITSDQDKNRQDNQSGDQEINQNHSNDQMTDRNHDEGEELTDDVKSEIEKIVKDVDSNINNVYVSTNPDFADLTNNYINDFNTGKPVRGMFDQIGNMIERIFPQNRR